MFIRDIDPIEEIGINLLETEDSDNFIDKNIELPLRKTCKILRKKGIETVMSSANKNNLLKEGQSPVEKDEVERRRFFLPVPTFEYAGIGYAWLMINFDSLSKENQEWLYSLEERVGENGDKIGERAIWFVRNMEPLKFRFTSHNQGYIVEKDKCSKYDEKCITLAYNDRYPSRVVILRKPVNTQTTVKEVEDYFEQMAQCFRSQVPTKSIHTQKLTTKIKDDIQK